MKITAAKDLRDLIDGTFKSNLRKIKSQSEFNLQYQKAIEKTFQSDFFSKSKEISTELVPKSQINYQILPSVIAVTNYIGHCWQDIYDESILISDNEAFDFASSIFTEFKEKQAFQFINISSSFSEQNIQNIIEMIRGNSNIKYIVALGGGRVMDIQKFIGYKTNITMITFPTSLASHVYASPKIHALPVIKKLGYELTIDGTPPHLALLDLSMLQKLYEDNPRLIYAGLGDISAFYTARSDWILSLEKSGKVRNYFVEALIEQVIDWLGSFPIVNNFKDWSMHYHLCQVLLCNITDWEGSPPASGSEHLFALSVEKYTKEDMPLHGELVALGVIIMSLIQSNDYEYISRINRRLKLPMSLATIGVDKAAVISGLHDSLQTGLSKNRYTVLNEINESELNSEFDKALNQLISEKIIFH